MTSLLVIDDEPLILETIGLAFPNYDVTTCANAQSGIDAFLAATPDVVLCDIRLPKMSGMELFEKLHRVDPKVPIILMTGHGTAGTAIEAMQRGAFEYVLKPLDPDTLIPIVEHAVETSRMTRVPALMPDNHADDEPDDGTTDLLIGQCPAMQEVYRSIGRVARQDVTVLILGDSGTGKEVIARAIYQYSSRSKGRFLAINCAAIPEQLLESDLFGHEKGSFTGADRKRIGKFELCNDGTLFLDEIGDMTPLMQTKILRVLQDQTFERVGGSDTIRTNARLIAATNRDLEKAIEDKQFRSDLFYRLNVYTIHLPPLRERGGDIRLLASHFVRRFARELGKDITGIAPEAMKLLTHYRWPGNVRELQSVIKHSLLEASGPLIVPAFLPDFLREAQSTSARSPSAPPGHDFAQLTRERLQAGSNDIHRELVNVAEHQILAEVLKHT
ncbi:MAG: sigma-54 dependent transcriptional regulator, partial [Planctomycetota bacterium]